MRSSFVILGGALLMSVFAAGCRIEAHTQTRFDNSPNTTKESTKDWTGERIEVVNDGINPATGKSGLEVKFDTAATKISITAEVSAWADDDKKSDADANIKDVLESGITLTEEGSGPSGVIKVHCGHGRGHGTSSAAGAGCKRLTLNMPVGSAQLPIDLVAGNGNGDLIIGTSSALGNIRSLKADNNGAGDVSVKINPIPNGGAIQVTGEFNVTVALPSTMSTKSVQLTVDEDDPAKATARIRASAFPGITSTKPYPVDGAKADAFASLSVNSKGILDSDYLTLSAF